MNAKLTIFNVNSDKIAKKQLSDIQSTIKISKKLNIYNLEKDDIVIFTKKGFCICLIRNGIDIVKLDKVSVTLQFYLN